MIIETIIHTLQIIMPAYLANASPTFLIKLKKHPVDFGKKLSDGNRILGNGKTIEGFFLACFVGYLAGLLELYIISQFDYNFLQIPAIGFFFIGMGAMLGDMGGSFLKRRKKIKRGENAGLLDMIDFMIGTLFMASFFVQYSIWVLILALLVTPAIHRLANIVGYNIGVKKEPW